MTTEEKLKHFHEASINSAYEKSTAAIQEYKSMLEKKYEDHKTEMLKKSRNEIKQETDNIIRNNNDKYSHAQNDIKIELNKKFQEITDRIFDELIELLGEYKKTEDYKNMLIRQINSVRTYVRWGEEQVIYIEASDTPLKEELERATNCTLTVAEDSFIGGIRAVVNQNILIDNSFLSKFDELKESFNLSKWSEYKNTHFGGSING